MLPVFLILTAYEMLWEMAAHDHPDLSERYRMVADVEPAPAYGSAEYRKH